MSKPSGTNSPTSSSVSSSIDLRLVSGSEIGVEGSKPRKTSGTQHDGRQISSDLSFLRNILWWL